jgi:hypothetical protein
MGVSRVDVVGHRITAGAQNSKCRLALESIAGRYRANMLLSYQTDWTTAFPLALVSSSDWHT